MKKNEDKELDLARKAEGEHTEIKKILSTLESFTCGRCAEGDELSAARRIAPDLRSLREHLVHHFELEEEGKLFEDIVLRLPWASEKAESVRDEHPRILQVVDALTERFQDVEESALETAREELCDFVRLLQRHESAENELIQQAYYTDVGTKD